jgi:cell division protein FtsL
MTEEKKDKVEFIDTNIEKEEITGFTLKGIIDGSILTVSSFVKQVPFILYLVLLTIIYIGNRYHAERVFRNMINLKDEVRDLRAEEITAASELMNLSKPSKVQDLIDQKGLGLKEPTRPPYKIVVRNK